MRPLEILTPIILAIYLLWPITGRKRPPAIGILPAFALLVIAAHANIEGMRWQMYPIGVKLRNGQNAENRVYLVKTEETHGQQNCRNPNNITTSL